MQDNDKSIQSYQRQSISSDLPSGRSTKWTPLSEREAVEAQANAAPPINNSAVPRDTTILECRRPDQLQQSRIEGAQLLAGRLLTQILDGLLDVMIRDSNSEDVVNGQYGFLLTDLPLDVVWCAVASLKEAGWTVLYDGDRHILINLPEIPLLGQPDRIHEINSAKPL